MIQGPVWCKRCLEHVLVSGDEVAIIGWVFSRDAGALKQLDVDTRSRGIACVRSLEIRASADVSNAFPGYGDATRCRFTLVLAKRSSESASALLAILRPVFERGSGRVWCIGVGLMSPPSEFIERVGGGAGVGLEFLEFFLDFAGLAEDDVLLDLGCGTGRMAIPLQRFLSDRGRYVGIDVDRGLIDWCRANIQASDRRFLFHHVAARNDMYNPGGDVDVTSVLLPVPTSSMSFGFAASLFTHLRAAHAEHYLHELGRILRPGGRLLISAFLMPAGEAHVTARSLGGQRFESLDSETWTTDRALPERVIGFRKRSIVRWASDSGLMPMAVWPGNWRSEDNGFGYQDILVFSKS